MEYTKTYICWNKFCALDKENRIPEEKLIKRVEDTDHIDLCCPECEKVIVCMIVKEEPKCATLI